MVEEYLWTHGRKGLLAQQEGMEQVLALSEQINDRPYDIPQKPLIDIKELSAFAHTLAANVEKRLIYGMETFLINHKEHNENDTTIIYLHGGGYMNQPYYEHFAFVDRLALEADCKAVVPLYPLTPKYTCEESHRAMMALYRSLLKATDPASIVLMGDSAGGGMALAMTQTMRDQGIPMPRALVLICPWLDVRCCNPEIQRRGLEEMDPMLTANFSMAGRAWAAGLPMDTPLVSPMFGELSGLPPITLYGGTREILWPDAQKFITIAKDQGVDID